MKFIINLLIRLKFYYSLIMNCDLSYEHFIRVCPHFDKHKQKLTDIQVWHPHGIFINPHVRMGNNCIIVGNNIIGNKNGYPQLGNNVFVGGGAVIIGDITIGDNFKIGANATVTKSVKANSTVIEFNKILGDSQVED